MEYIFHKLLYRTSHRKVRVLRRDIKIDWRTNMHVLNNRLSTLPTEIAFSIAERCETFTDAAALMQAHGGAISDSALRVLKSSRLWSQAFCEARQVAPSVYSAGERSTRRAQATEAGGLTGLTAGCLGQLPIWIGAVVGQFTWPPNPEFIPPTDLGTMLKIQLAGMGSLVGLLPLGFAMGRLIAPSALRQGARSWGEYQAANSLAEQTRYILSPRERLYLQYKAAVSATTAAAAIGGCAITMSVGLAVHIGFQLSATLAAVSPITAALILAADIGVLSMGVRHAFYFLRNEGAFAALRADMTTAWADGYHAGLNHLDATMKARGFE